MTLVELRYLVSLAEERHFGRAAERCCVSQPTLSMAIKRLERELGVALFERSASGVWLTAQGEQVLVRARRALTGVADIERLAESAGRDDLSLTLGALPSLASALVPRLLPYLHQQCEGHLELTLEQGDVQQLTRGLLAGALDLLLVCQPFTAPDVVTRALYDEPLMVLLPDSHRLASQGSLTAECLLDDPLLLPEAQEGARASLEACCPTLLASVDRTLQLKNASLTTVQQLVASGAGISLVPQSIASPQALAADGLLLKPLTGAAPTRTLALAWRTSFPRHALVDRLTEALQVTAPCHWLTQGNWSDAGLLVDNGYW